MGFNDRTGGIVVTYMAWSESLGEGGLDRPLPLRESVQGPHKIWVLAFSELSATPLKALVLILLIQKRTDSTEGDTGISAMCTLLPHARRHTRVPELYWNTYLRCTYLGIPFFVRGL